MTQTKGKIKSRRKGLAILIIIASVFILFFAVQGVLCGLAVSDGYKRLETYGAQEMKLSHGTVSYVDKGEGDVILSIHGIFGGYDQAFDSVQNLTGDYRVIAPSRFGYLGSDVPSNPSPKEQAKVFAELLDALGIDQVYLMVTSAGGTTAIRFALDYPERVKGLVLLSSAMPYAEKPDTYPEYAGPPEFLISDFGMWLLSPFFGPVMGMESDVIYSMLPVSERREGSIIDASIANPDMARHFDEYPIENLQPPVLILQAKDDKMSLYEQTEQALPRFPDSTPVIFETGGHLLEGHGEEVDAALRQFLEDNAT